MYHLFLQLLIRTLVAQCGLSVSDFLDEPLALSGPLASSPVGDGCCCCCMDMERGERDMLSDRLADEDEDDDIDECGGAPPPPM